MEQNHQPQVEVSNARIRYRREPSLSPCGARLSLDDSYHY